MKEIWKDIPNYEGRYQASNLGNIRSLINNKILKLNQNKRDGYLYVGLCKNSKRKNCKVHRLIAKTFILNLKNKPTVNHIDGNKLNNEVRQFRMGNIFRKYFSCHKNRIKSV